jgi:uncharacterized protein YutE (UPF0331/DUF86 family)
VPLSDSGSDWPQAGRFEVTDKGVVSRKLASLKEHVGRLRRRRGEDLAAFQANVDLQDAVAMSLLVAVQDTLDIALHLASDGGWGIPPSYAESFALLERHAVLDPQLARSLVRMATLRNRIAHGYATVDLDRIWAELPAGIDALDAFASTIAAWIDHT